ITNSGIEKVADFGIAHATSKKTITFGGNIVGSVQYISPEQAKGEPVTRATDIYSLGCVLYEILTGKIPYDAESPITIALKHIHDEPVLPSEINSNIPKSLENIILKAMAKLPKERFLSAEEMRNSLLTFHVGKGKKYTPRSNNDKTIVMPPISGEGDEGLLRKKKVKTSGLAIVIVAIIGLLSGILFVAGSNFFGSEVVVPDILGMDIKEAKAELEKNNLKMTVIHEEFNDEYDVDEVISQDPKGGMKVKEGREIKVVISKGVELISIPNVVGQTIADAELTIRNEGFTVGAITKTYDSKYPENTVISQDPTSGTKKPKNTTINLMISQGEPPQRIEMPQLIGLTLNDARNKLQENNLILGEIKKEDSNEYFADVVIAQDIQAGVLVDEESSVILTVSKGPGPVAQTRAIEFILPEDLDFYKVVIRVNDGKGKREVYNELKQAGETVYIGVSYFGKGTAEVILNGKLFQTFDL
ncbi:MAG: PASTA domain-containing protein, partial [Syntrophomonadaceae bacterium]|nr:PASTA domain-containing protein [Syntrophomonadaceae bacterium]